MSAVFVHVSDIHFGQEKGEQFILNSDVKQQIIIDAKEVVTSIAGGTVEGILVTGDIAQSGQRTQYQDAAKWLDALATNIGVGLHCVQMVPGNHDQNRDKKSRAWESAFNYIRAGGIEEYEEIIGNPVDRSALFSQFEEYSQFSVGYNCPLNSDAGYASEMKVPLAPGRAIRFIRLNSALLCQGDEKHEHPALLLGARQFAIPTEPGVENIILVHHPLNWYKDQDDIQNYIRNRARVFISGHEHNPKVLIDEVEPGSDLMMLAAGATVPYKSVGDYTYTYNVIEFDWDEEFDALSVTIHPRAWNIERVRFEADTQRLGGKDPTFRLASPFFRKAQRPESPPQVNSADTQKTEVQKLSLVATTVTAAIEMNEDSSMENMEFQAMLVVPDGYPVARLRFFRDLFEGERLRILVELNALESGFDERLTQNLEGRLFDQLVSDGLLSKVEVMISQLISERKSGAKE
jgi:calcineurin-like phosphoesterase family protein